MTIKDGVVVVMLFCGAFTVDAQPAGWTYGQTHSFMGKTYSQEMWSWEGTPYPDWNPGEAVCPLHPTNAVLLAIRAATEAFPNIGSWKQASLRLTLFSSPGDAHEIWFYEVTLRALVDTDYLKEGPVCIPILVGLNGHVPRIQEHGARNSGGRDDPAKRITERWEETIRNEKGDAVFDGMTPGEKAEYIKQYQWERIHQRTGRLPIPLPPEDDARLVKEGVLPPLQEDRNVPTKPSTATE